MTMLKMNITERHPNGRLVFDVRMQSALGRLEVPISIDDQGTQTRNEGAVLRTAIELAGAFAADAKGQLAT
jgi:hypothetical protein